MGCGHGHRSWTLTWVVDMDIGPVGTGHAWTMLKPKTAVTIVASNTVLLLCKQSK